MSFIFNDYETIHASFTIQDSHHSDTILVAKSIWGRIQQPGSDRIAVSVSCPYSKNALICWALLDEEANEIAVSPKWLKTFSHTLHRSNSESENVVTVTSTEPVLLTEVIVTALSDDAYRVATVESSPLESWLSNPSTILRQGELYSFNSELLSDGHTNSNQGQTYHYRLDMTAPVMQGLADANSTRFYVSRSSTSADESLSLDEATLESEESGSEPDNFEIDESFLAGSVLHARSNASQHESQPIVNGSHTQDHASGSLDRLSMSSSEVRLLTLPLLRPAISSQEESYLYLRTSDLGKIGARSGDWAITHSEGLSSRRLVRLFARDDLVCTPGFVMGSPILFHNLKANSQLVLQSAILIQASPFGSQQPTIPTARSVTVARVASPSSVDRAYQSSFLGSLKTYFDSAKRLVKNGDIIALGLDTDAASRLGDPDPTKEEITDDEEFTYHEPDYPASSVRNNEVVYFVITNVENDVTLNHIISQDMHAGAAAGELGCWVNASVTRVTQVGLEHLRVPNMWTYMGGDTNGPGTIFATLKLQQTSSLLSVESAYGKLLALSSAALGRYASDYDLHLSVLLKGARGIGKMMTARWVAQQLGVHLLEINCYDILGESDVKTEGSLRARFEKAGSCSPCILTLSHIDALAQTTQTIESGKESVLEDVLRDCLASLASTWKITGYPVLVFGTVGETGRVPPGILACFKHEVSFEAPTERDRHEILSALLHDLTLAPDVSLANLATQTAALVASDLVDLVGRACLIAVNRVFGDLSQNPNTEYLFCIQAGVALSATDFEGALGKARASYSQSIGAPNIPNVSWDDVGGLAHVKTDILDTIQLPLDHPELFADGLKKRSGILLYGPPGTGKTLLAKAVATSCSLNFFSVKGPELLNMYIGESEANVRRVFQRARDAKPCVIFFDELDSVAPKRGNHGDSGGVMDRIVSQLLAELDGMSAGQGGADVFVIGATNRPDLLDPALLRPGRFDRMLYLGVSDTHNAQLDILLALTRKFRLDPTLDLRRVAESCPFNYTGADFYALCSDAMLNAMSRKAEELEAKLTLMNNQPALLGHPFPLTTQYYLAELITPDELGVLVSQGDFDQAFQDLVPSVSQSEMDHYATIQKRFSRKSLDTSENSAFEPESGIYNSALTTDRKGKGRAMH